VQPPWNSFPGCTSLLLPTRSCAEGLALGTLGAHLSPRGWLSALWGRTFRRGVGSQHFGGAPFGRNLAPRANHDGGPPGWGGHTSCPAPHLWFHATQPALRHICGSAPPKLPCATFVVPRHPNCPAPHLWFHATQTALRHICGSTPPNLPCATFVVPRHPNLGVVNAYPWRPSVCGS